MSHNAALIEGLISLILVSVLFLAFRSFKAPPESAAHVGAVGNLGELEETLKKLLEKASIVPNSSGGGPSPELLGEIEVLKNSLQEKQAEIENLKTISASAAVSAPAGSGMSDEERTKLDSQLKELKGKLEEYEIISEDIADLSFYKEENAKLLKQLEGLKSGAAAAPAPAAAPPPTPAAPPPVAPPPVAAAPAPEPEVASTAPVAQVSSGVDDDLMAEFARAVAAQTGAAVAPAEPEPPAAPEPVVEAAPVVEAEPVAAPAAEVEAQADLGSMDLDKMVAEAETIGGAADLAEAPANALEASMDTDKLIQEASDLGAVPVAVKPEDKDLMSEFEDFVKGT